MAGGHTGRGLLLGGGRRCILLIFLLRLYPPLLVGLEDIAGDSFAEFFVVGAAVLREGELGAVDVGVDVVVSDFVFGPEASNVVCYVGPRTQTVRLSALEQGQFLVGSPIVGEDGYGVLLNDLVGVGPGVMLARVFAIGEAGDTEVVFVTSIVGTADADLQGSSTMCTWNCNGSGSGSWRAVGTYRRRDVGGTHVTDVLDAALGAPRRGLLLDEAHGAPLSAGSAGEGGSPHRRRR